MVRDYGRLAAYLAERRVMPFAWGRHGNDCVSFVAGAIVAQGGRYPFRGLRWETALGAGRILAREGGLQALIDRRLTAIPLAQAHRGDVVLVRNEDGPDGLGLGLIDGMLAIGPGERGTEARPVADALRCWSAG